MYEHNKHLVPFASALTGYMWLVEHCFEDEEGHQLMEENLIKLCMTTGTEFYVKKTLPLARPAEVPDTCVNLALRSNNECLDK